MSLSTTYSTPLIVQSNYDGTSTSNILKGLNVTFLDEDGDETLVDNIYVEITDALDDTVTLTENTIPQIETTGFSYRVDEVDVTGYPSGDITVKWTATNDGYDYDLEHTVAYGTTSNIIVMSGLTATTIDTTVRQDTSKTLHVKLYDINGNETDGYAVRAKFRDRLNNNALISTQDASLTAAGSGIWSLTYSFPSSIFNSGIDRYEIYWEYQLELGDSWKEVSNSRQLLSVTSDSDSLTTGALAYCSEQDVRTVFPNIDRYLLPFDENKANRDLLLQNKIYEVTEEIYHNTKNKISMTPHNKRLIKYWCAYATALDFVQFGSDNLAENVVYKRLMAKINQHKISIFGNLRFTDVGSGRRHYVKDKDYLIVRK